MGRGYAGKAMVVCIDKATAVLMYDKVRAQWQRHRDELAQQIPAATAIDKPVLDQRVSYMDGTDMAVVVSQSQNEIADFRDKGLDIEPHRRRMVADPLDEKFKDSNDPLRLVFVCAMWMTGFDAPACSTIYLDKPMRNHTLMQTIARANRVFREKVNGLIVDYEGVFRHMQKELAIYGAPGAGGDTPILDKEQLVERLREALAQASTFCAEVGVDIPTVRDARGFERVKLIDDAADAALVNDDAKRRFMTLARTVDRLFKAILPDARANEFGLDRAVFVTIAEKIRSLGPKVDITDTMEAVGELLDVSVKADSSVIRKDDAKIDLSRVGF